MQNQTSIYQIVHTLDGTVYHLEEHIKLLFEGYYQIFGSGVSLPLASMQQQFEALLKRSRCPKGVSLFARVEISASGEVSLSEYERSLYRGYSLRCISPRAAIIDFNIPHMEYPSSVRQSVIAYANCEARRHRAELAIRRHNGIIDIINGAQIFIATANGIVTAKESLSVEHHLAKNIAKECGINIIERPIQCSELETCDELFFADHYGVTAIRSCAGQSYMAITAGKIAALMGEVIG